MNKLTIKGLPPVEVYRPEGAYRPKKLDLTQVFIEPKWDGRWVRLDTRGDYPLAYGHDVSETHGTPTFLPRPLAERLAGFLPSASVVDGELVWPNHAAAEVQHALVTCPHVLEFRPFAVPIWEGDDLTLYSYSGGRSVVSNTLALPPRIVEVGVPSLEQVETIWKERWPTSEGLVIKRYWYQDWWKWKPVRTADLIVADFTIGTAGKWKGLPNAMLLCTMLGTDAGRCGNMSDMDRLAIPEHVGQVVEVAFDCLTCDGKLRFPRFVRWRDDKSPTACKELKEQV